MTIRILYVDDEDDIREVALLSLELDAGLEVTVCASGQEALDFAPLLVPDLILLDVMMPRMDGMETLARLRADARTEHIPVIFVTARTQAAEQANLIALGAMAVIAKPFEPMTLSSVVRSYI